MWSLPIICRSFPDFPGVFLQVFPHRKPSLHPTSGTRDHPISWDYITAGNTGPHGSDACWCRARQGSAMMCENTAWVFDSILIHTYPQTEIVKGEKNLQIARDCENQPGGTLDYAQIAYFHWFLLKLKPIFLSNYLGSCHGDTLLLIRDDECFSGSAIPIFPQSPQMGCISIWILVPSGKHTKDHGKSPFLGKLTISIAIFYVANCQFTRPGNRSNNIQYNPILRMFGVAGSRLK